MTLYNVDRWANYTRQNFSRQIPGNRVMDRFALCGLVEDWSTCTPKQNRRMRKRARKGDGSIGMC